MTERALPAADAKVGAKIDYLAKRLGRLLAPLGFQRQGRRLQARTGEGPQSHWQLVQLQAGPWNEGPRGVFYVNLALQFPAIERVLAQREGQAWRLERIDTPDEASGHLRQRLEALLHDAEPQHALAGSEIRIGADTDLARLADQLEAACRDTALPWLQQHGRLEALRDFTGSLLTADIPVRIAAAVALGDLAGASRLVAAHTARWGTFHAAALAELRRWLQALGVDGSALPAAPVPRPPSPGRQQREAREQAESQALAEQACALVATGQTATLASAWLAEYRAQRRRDPAPLTGLAVGQRIAALPAPERERVLLDLLALLTAAEASAQRHPVHVDADAFRLDDGIRPLLTALLTTLPAASAAHCLGVVEAITALLPRLQQDLITATYPWGLAELVPWLCQVGQPHHARLAPAVAACLARLSELIPARHAEVEAALAAERQQPLDPASPLYEAQREARERLAELQAQAPPVDPADVQRRLREYPEQALAAEDKHAIIRWRQWLQRDPVTGALPLVLEPDDWGGPWNLAWGDAPAALRQAAAPLLQPWLEGLDAKPGARWQKALRAAIVSFDPAQVYAWRAWLLQRLQALPDTQGRTEWATTGARPGVGARLGERSESMLIGLLWWTALDAGFSPEQRAAAWRRVADAAWLRLKDVGARAPAVGGLALRLLAGLGGEARAHVEACSRAKGAKQLAKAAQRALADPAVPLG